MLLTVCVSIVYVSVKYYGALRSWSATEMLTFAEAGKLICRSLFICLQIQNTRNNEKKLTLFSHSNSGREITTGQRMSRKNAELPGQIRTSLPVIMTGKGVLPFVKGVLPFVKGVLPFEKGVLLFEKGVLLFEKGVLLFEKGVLPFEN